MTSTEDSARIAYLEKELEKTRTRANEHGRFATDLLESLKQLLAVVEPKDTIQRFYVELAEELVVRADSL